jgi:hypothetical protein
MFWRNISPPSSGRNGINTTISQLTIQTVIMTELNNDQDLYFYFPPNFIMNYIFIFSVSKYINSDNFV